MKRLQFCFRTQMRTGITDDKKKRDSSLHLALDPNTITSMNSTISCTTSRLRGNRDFRKCNFANLTGSSYAMAKSISIAQNLRVIGYWCNTYCIEGHTGQSGLFVLNRTCYDTIRGFEHGGTKHAPKTQKFKSENGKAVFWYQTHMYPYP